MKAKMRVRWRVFGAGLLALATVALPNFAVAQEPFPNRPITIVVPYPAGGTTDLLARVMQAPLQRFLKQPVVVDNKPGASGALASMLVARAPADGYTLLFPNNGLVISPQLSKSAEYDPLKDFAPLSLVSLQPMVLVVNPAVPANNVQELIDYAKANPGKLEFASAGATSFGRLATELFDSRTGIKMLHVPYKGQGPTMQAILTGEAKVLLTTSSAQMNGFIKEGKLRLLGVSSLEASPLAPGAAPIANTVPGFNPEVWFALVAPAGTPGPVVKTLNEAIRQTLALPEVKDKFESAGAAATSSTPQQMAARLSQEYSTWSTVIHEANIQAD